MKRIAVIIFTLSVLGAVSASAVDFGGLVYNETSVDVNGSTVFGQEDKLSVWFNSGTEHPLVFYIGGSYTFSLERYYLFDLYDFRLKGTFKRQGELPSVFGFTLGRFRLGDYTYSILNHSVDGLNLTMTYPYANVNVNLGFTGLMLKPVSEVIISKLDYNDQNIDSVILGSKRVVGKVETSIPNLFQRQKLTLSFLFQEDLRKVFENENTPALSRVIEEGETVYDPQRGGLVDTQYVMLGMSGPIIPRLFYNVYGYLNTGRELSYLNGVYTYTPILAFLTGAELRYYNRELLFSRAALRFIYTSGDADSLTFVEGNTAGKATTFIPISIVPMGLVFTPVLGNIFYPHVSYSIRPLAHTKSPILQSIQPQVDTYMFFRSTTGAISEGGVDPSSASLYLGTELDLTVRFRPFSDLGVSLAAGWFFPSQTTFIEGNRDVAFLGRLTANLSW